MNSYPPRLLLTPWIRSLQSGRNSRLRLWACNVMFKEKRAVYRPSPDPQGQNQWHYYNREQQDYIQSAQIWKGGESARWTSRHSDNKVPVFNRKVHVSYWTSCRKRARGQVKMDWKLHLNNCGPYFTKTGWSTLSSNNGKHDGNTTFLFSVLMWGVSTSLHRFLLALKEF